MVSVYFDGVSCLFVVMNECMHGMLVFMFDCGTYIQSRMHSVAVKLH